MKAKTNKDRQESHKARRKAEGLVRLELWVKPDHKEPIKTYAKLLSVSDVIPLAKEPSK